MRAIRFLFIGVLFGILRLTALAASIDDFSLDDSQRPTRATISDAATADDPETGGSFGTSTSLSLGRSYAKASQRVAADVAWRKELASYNPKPIPSGPELKTHQHFLGAKLDLEHEALRQGFAQSTSNLQISRAADRFLKAYFAADQPPAPRPGSELNAACDELAKLGCNDPYIAYCMGMAGGWREDDKAEIEGLDRALKIPQKTHGDALLLLSASLKVRNKTLENTDKGRSERALKCAVEAFTSLINDKKLPPNVDRDVIQIINNNSFRPYDPVLYSALLAAAMAAMEKNPWLARTSAGCFEIMSAWAARGAGFANVVTDKGWEGHFTHCANARKLLVAAWESAPDRPEAAARMVELSMCDSANPLAEMRQWFDRAVAAQLDCPDAYKWLLWGLMPRWHGDPQYNRLVAFGAECADVDRFDTSIPLYFLRSLLNATADQHRDEWRLVFRPQLADATLKRIAGGYSKNLGFLTPNESAALAVLVADWSGRYEDSAELLKKLTPGEELNLGPAVRDVARFPFIRRKRTAVEAELRAMTGNRGPALNRVQDLDAAGKRADALEAMKQSLAAETGDPLVREYLRDRIALRMLRQSEITWRHDAEGYGQDIAVHAAAIGQRDVLEFMLDHGIDVNGKGSVCTPFQKAAEMGHSELVKHLLSRGGNPNSTAEGRWTPFISAIDKGDLNLVRLMLDHGADPNLSIENQFTRFSPLYFAAANDNVAMIELLLASGGDPNKSHSKNEITPLDASVTQKKPNALARLRTAGAGMNSQSTMFAAIAAKDVNLVAYLLEHGGKVESVGTLGTTPLHAAATADDVPMIDFLLAHGADINATNDVLKITPLDAAAGRNKTKAMERLEAAGGKRLTSNVPGKPGVVRLKSWTPLHAAALKGDIGKVQELIAKGADVNALSSMGATPLHAAVFTGVLPLVQTLMSAGAKAKPLTEGGWNETMSKGIAPQGIRPSTANPLPMFDEDAKRMPDIDHTPMTCNVLANQKLLDQLSKDPDWKQWSAGLQSGVQMLK